MTSKLFLACVWSALSLSSGTLSRAQTSEPSSVENDTTSNADQDWVLIRALIASQSDEETDGIRSVIRSRTYRDRFLTWRELSDRLLRDAGLDFYERYPNDSRRWQWVIATLLREPTYHPLSPAGIRYDLPFDSTANQAWELRKPQLIAALLAAPNATDRQKATVAFYAYDANWADRQNREARVGKYLDEFLKLAARYPSTSNYLVRNPTLDFVSYARKDSVDGPAILDKLRASPNPAVRQVANSEIERQKAKVMPVEIKFTAIDGRKVDLAKLRGKVVLVEFTAYTWCGQCRVIEPEIIAAYDEYRDKGFEIIGIALENDMIDSSSVTRYLKKHGIKWPIYFEGRGFEKNEYVQKFGLIGVPHVLLFDRNGLLIAEASGAGGMRAISPTLRKQFNSTTANR